MAGLQLSAGAWSRSGSGIGFGGSSLPTAANQPSGTTINQAAFGIRSGVGRDCGPKTAGFGTTAVAGACAVLLVWVWWSLPR